MSVKRMAREIGEMYKSGRKHKKEEDEKIRELRNKKKNIKAVAKRMK